MHAYFTLKRFGVETVFTPKLLVNFTNICKEIASNIKCEILKLQYWNSIFLKNVL